MNMGMRLSIDGWGAVTSVGLTAPQVCAAIRAGLCGFSEVFIKGAPTETTTSARVPVSWRLRRTEGEWLVNLASRALRECLADEKPNPSLTALLLCLPESSRDHPGTQGRSAATMLHELQQQLGVALSPYSMVLPGGPAVVVEGLQRASDLLTRQQVSHCIVGGVDSLLNARDITRLEAARRLHSDDNPQGLVPGEGAAFVLLSDLRRPRRHRSIGVVMGAGISQEVNTIHGDDYSVGQGIRAALRRAATDARVGEEQLDFVCSTFNGERYGAWESMIARPRFYRTRREQLPVVYPAMSVGEIGTAAGALAILYAAMSIARGYAPGRLAMCELASDGGGRSACVVGAPPHLPAFEAPNRRIPS